MPRSRKTPIYPCELKRLKQEQQARQRRRRRRPPGERYNTDSYRRAVQRGIQKANAVGIAVPWWFPHQLRHTRGTEVRKKFGVEGAQHSLGLAKIDMAELYAERDLGQAQRIARKIG